MQETFRKVHPTQYYRKFLDNKIRPDGRKFAEFRNTGVDVGCLESTVGSSVVRIGNTSVMCGIRAQFAPPAEGLPTKGFIIPTVHTSAVFPFSQTRQQNDKANQLSDFLMEFINKNWSNQSKLGNNDNENKKKDSSNDIIDLNQLEVFAGEIVWALYVDITCLDDDGCLKDACLLAFTSALRNVLLPEVEVDEDKGTAIPSATNSIPLKLNFCPVSSTCAIVDNGIMVLDPTREEIKLAGCCITIVVDGNGKLRRLQKPGGVLVSETEIRLAFKAAISRYSQVKDIIEPLFE